MRWYTSLIVTVLSSLTATSHAGYIVDLPDLVAVNAGDTGVVIIGTYEVTDGDPQVALFGADLGVMISATGPLPPGTPLPQWTAMDYDVSGYLFAGADGLVQGSTTIIPPNIRRGLDVRPAFTPSSSPNPRNLVMFTLDIPTNVASGTYSLDFYNGNTVFDESYDNIATFQGGSLQVQGQEEIPEPASLLLMAGLMACGAPALVAHRRRKRAAAPTGN